MARRPRVLLPGIPLHIIQRGNNRSACFYSDEDYIFYIDTLAVLAQLYGCKIHALCLMTNHVHLLLTPTCCAGAGAALCSICQSNISTNGHIVGRPFPLLFGSTRKLCFSLLSIYRNESGKSGYGYSSGRLSLDQL